MGTHANTTRKRILARDERREAQNPEIEIWDRIYHIPGSGDLDFFLNLEISSQQGSLQRLRWIVVDSASELSAVEY